MSEISFAKTFLSALDSRPRKLSPDHVEDPKSYSARPPYTLPKMPKPMSKRVTLAPGQERSVTVHVKSLRNPPLDIKLTSQPLSTTSVLDIKTAIAAQASLLPDKIKVLHKKKPVADSKVLKDLIGDDETTVEFSVMVMGGAAAVAASPAPAATSDAAAATAAATTPEAAEEGSAAVDTAAPVAQGPSGEAVLETDAFWTDLRGFLLQRLRDEKITEELFGRFLSSWEMSR